MGPKKNLMPEKGSKQKNFVPGMTELKPTITPLSITIFLFIQTAKQGL